MDWRQPLIYLTTLVVTLVLIAVASQTGVFARVVEPPRLAAAPSPRPTLTPEPPRAAGIPTSDPTPRPAFTATPVPSPTVPPTATPPPTATVAPTPTATTVPDPTATPAPPPTPTVVVASIHTIEKGETLFTIAQRYGLTTDELARANNITDPKKIYYGQKLIIPKR